VREFLLVVTDLLRVPPDAGEADGGALAALRFGAALALPGGDWRCWLAPRLESAIRDGRSLAATVAAAQPEPGLLAEGAWLATPLHLVAGLDTLHLPSDGILTLEPAERSALAASFGTALGGDGLALHVVDGDALLLTGLNLPGVATVEPASCLGADLARAQPAGSGATKLRRLMAEIEMWLHEHPVNLRREAAGRRAVRALWLWGGGPRPAIESAAAPARIQRVHSDDAWVRAAASLAGVALAPQSEPVGAAAFAARDDEDLVATVSWQAPEVADPAAFEQRHLAPAVHALASGRLQRLTIVAARRCVTVEASDRYRLWRPRRAWLVALGAEG